MLGFGDKFQHNLGIATMQVYDTAECLTGQTLLEMVYCECTQFDCIAIHSIDDVDHNDDHQKVGNVYRYSVIRRNYSSVLHQVISQPYSVIGQLGIAS